ncbi:Zinc transporter ZIP1 [Orchesella cincta]|uniref:Zinc transporter ZIP1 n=1 Tax=Orchesella cincta TaxID=48709 RepID=A0A1D2NKR5_ORCCI|nr:Zinc transporter ZIP1 [Orchesella cincta]
MNQIKLPPSSTSKMELLSVKLIVLVLMGAVRIVCGMLPLAIVKIIKRRWSKTADRRLKKCISVLVFFGGGVMLATCFLHMMPEVEASFNEALPSVHLPVPQVIFVMGFFLVYMMEDIVHAMIHKRKRAKRLRKKKEGKNTPAENGGRMEKSGELGSPGTDIGGAHRYNNNDSIAIIGKDGSYLNGGLCYANNYPDHYRKQQLTTSEVTARETKDIFDKNVVRKCDDIPGLPKSRIISTTNITPKRNGATGNGGRVVASGLGVEKFSHLPVTFIDGDEELDQTIGAEIRNLLIVIAISFHGIFEGMAIGLQDTAEDVWYMFFAVSLHECTILFCIGIELISNKTKVLRMVLYVLIVSLVSPIGIAIGIIITERSFGNSSAQALVVGCFQAS